MIRNAQRRDESAGDVGQGLAQGRSVEGTGRRSGDAPLQQTTFDDGEERRAVNAQGLSAGAGEVWALQQQGSGTLPTSCLLHLKDDVADVFARRCLAPKVEPNTEQSRGFVDVT